VERFDWKTATHRRKKMLKRYDALAQLELYELAVGHAEGRHVIETCLVAPSDNPSL
jgi:hypothetical protein